MKMTLTLPATIYDFPSIHALATRLVDVCETCADRLAHFDCETCGRRTCNACKVSSVELVESKFCREECAKEAEEMNALARKSGW